MNERKGDHLMTPTPSGCQYSSYKYGSIVNKYLVNRVTITTCADMNIPAALQYCNHKTLSLTVLPKKRKREKTQRKKIRVFQINKFMRSDLFHINHINVLQIINSKIR